MAGDAKAGMVQLDKVADNIKMFDKIADDLKIGDIGASKSSAAIGPYKNNFMSPVLSPLPEPENKFIKYLFFAGAAFTIVKVLRG